MWCQVVDIQTEKAHFMQFDQSASPQYSGI